jgi:signal transduction histidine kinase
MANAQLVDRLAALENLAHIPREELEWLVAHGEYRAYEPGDLVAPKGKPIDALWVQLSGRISIHVDRGVGPRRVIEWRTGDVSGKLPYSRMTGPPGNTIVEERSELLGVSVKYFPEMVTRCPTFVAHTVHLMLDRARSFNASDLHDEKMISLGRLAAGLAHELNNPASATARGAKLLVESLAEADAASRALGAAGLSTEVFGMIEQARMACAAAPGGPVLSPIEQADREDAIANWLDRHGSDPAHAAALAGTAVTIETLDELAAATSGETLNAALRWLAAGCATRSLATDIEHAATRIYELVAAIKKFTYMDHRAGSESVDVEPGLRDTLRVLASKAKSKSAAVALDIGAGLPRVCANGGELNQVWLNLIDNALDAIPEGGRIEVGARRERDRVVVRVVDNGAGIPADALPQIFDAFFTTKPPGQGTGLGLEIARRLVRRYHGDIAVQSRPGRTEFRVSLPVVGAPGSAAPEPDHDQGGSASR